MSLIFTINKLYRMRQDLSDIFIVQHIDSLVLSKGIIEDIHDDAHVIHHTQRTNSWSDIAFIPPIENYFDTAHASWDNTYQSCMLFHYLINDF